MTISFAGQFGMQLLDETQAVADTIAQAQQTSVQNGWHIIIMLTARLAAIGMALSIGWLVVMLCCSGFLIQLSLAIITAMLGFLAWFSYYALCTDEQFITKESTMEHNTCWAPSIVFGVLFLLMLAYWCCIQSRIRFAAANLEVACSAILRNPGTHFYFCSK
jgi:hypothetical protein